jgi:serine/threonine protein kinase
MKCPQCGTGLEEAARFCGVCGFRVPDAAPVPSGRLTAMERPSGRRPAEPAAAAAPAPAPAQAFAPQPGDDPYVGATLNNRFVIESKLGEGGFGAVYRGVQHGTNRKVAIKLLHPEMTRDQNVLARFRREGQVLCSLKDAHTITTYDFDQTPDGTLFIAMELLEGRSLHDLFQSEAPVAWQRMLRIMAQMCTALEEAHALGIVHRDLKPENVYLESRPGNDEFVKVLDFGIAKVVRGDSLAGEQSPQLTATGQTLGTLEYMSPEQLMGKPLDGRSDIYGLAVVAFELMTGRLPFPDAVGPALLISAQLKKVPPPPSQVLPAAGIPPAVDALILRMLEKNREQRFADAHSLRGEIDRILASGGDQPGMPSAQAVSIPTPYPTPQPGAMPPPGLYAQQAGRYPTPPPGAMPQAGPYPTPYPGNPQAGYSAGASGWQQAGPGASSTEAALAASRSSRRWLYLVIAVLVVAGAVVGGLLASR